MENIERLQPRAFTKFCMSIGMVPSSYTSALTYEEQLLWFCSYLEKEVIPAVNNNAEALQEVQNLMVQLQDYVNHYFDNLDVQEEINNKLDEMVESGEFDNILNEYINGQITFYWPTYANQSVTNAESGNCCYMKTQNKVIVIDTMMREDNFNRVAQSMIANGITKIDYFIISHLDYDHYGNIGLFVQQFDCSECLFLLPRVPNNPTIHDEYQTAYNNIISALEGEGITNYRFADNEEFEIDNVKMKLFNASVEDLNYYDNLSAQYNNYSICTEFDYKDKKALFTGDIFEQGQIHIRQEGYIGSNYDLMQDCHHSTTYYDALFMNMVHPKIVIAPTSKGAWSNIYNFTPTLDFYSSYNADIYIVGLQDETLQFNLNSYGVNLVSKGITTSGIKVNMGHKTYYVDSETTEEIHAGTQDLPFASLKEAVGLLSKDMPDLAHINIINLSEDELSQTIYLSYAKDWVILGNNNTLPNFKIFDSSVKFYQCTFANEDDDFALDCENSDVRLDVITSTSTADKFIRAVNSNIYVATSLTLSNKGIGFSIFNNSFIDFDTALNGLTLSNVTRLMEGLTAKIVIRPIPLAYIKTYYTNPTNIIIPSEFKQCIVSENMSDLYVLFSGNTDNFSTITLKDSSANYEYLEIYYRGKYVGINSIKIPKAEYENASLKAIHIAGDSSLIISDNTMIEISGTSINTLRSVNYTINNTKAIADYTTTNEVRIMKIIGLP